MNKILRAIFSCTMLSIIATSCNEKREKNLTHEILFYYRVDSGSSGDRPHYLDLLVVTNYENNTMTTSDFLKIALKYIDTVRSDRPVGAIDFVGQEQGFELPKGNWQNRFEQRKYFIITLGFSNGLKKFVGKPLKLTEIQIWKNDKSTDYSTPDAVDSVLQSKIPLSNR